MVPVAGHISTASRVKRLSTGAVTQARPSRLNDPFHPARASRRRRLASAAPAGLQVITTLAPTRPSHPSIVSSQSFAPLVLPPPSPIPPPVRPLPHRSPPPR